MTVLLDNIQQRGGAFLVDLTKEGKRHRVTCASLEEAQIVKDKLKRSVAVHKALCWTLGEAFKRVSEDGSKDGWRGRSSAKHLIANGQRAVDFFGEKTPLDEITTDWIDGYSARLAQLGLSGGTINRKMAALSKIIGYAVHRDKCVKRPRISRQEETQGRLRFLTQEEEQRSLAYLSQWGQDDHAEAFCVLVDTGLRPSELWRLEGRDCNFQHGVLTLWDTKNKQPRSVPMTQRVKQILGRRHELTATGPLFPFDNFWMARMWDRMRCAMGLQADEQFIPYALRHTCASRLVQRGVSLKVVQEWMGHKTIQVTLRYAHLSPANLLDAVKVLEAC